MSKKNRAAAKAAMRRKARRARESRPVSVAGGGVLERIGDYFVDKGFSVSELADGVDGSLTALVLEFKVHMASGGSTTDEQSREMVVYVMLAEKSGLVEVCIPNAWSLEGASNYHRARLLEALLAPAQSMRLFFCDGLGGPAVSIGSSDDGLPEKVEKAVCDLFKYVAQLDPSVRQTLKTGHWVQPGVEDVTYEVRQREMQELVCRVEKQMEERRNALLGELATALQVIDKHANDESNGDRNLCIDFTNTVFVVRGRTLGIKRTLDVDELERAVNSVVSRANELEAQTATSD